MAANIPGNGRRDGGTDRRGFLLLLLLTISFLALKLSGVTRWSWWWVFAPALLMALVIAFQAVVVEPLATVGLLMVLRDPRRALVALTVDVRTFRGRPGERSGRPAPLTVDVRVTIKGAAIDWSAAANREQLTDQVMDIIEASRADIREMLGDKLAARGWA
jgi:hypothetical protein